MGYFRGRHCKCLRAPYAGTLYQRRTFSWSRLLMQVVFGGLALYFTGLLTWHHVNAGRELLRPFLP